MTPTPQTEAEEDAEDDISVHRGKKRLHSKVEEDARQAVAKAFVVPPDNDEDDDLFGGF
jgi:hypothetical protein